jgi:hypothetical protein
MSGQSAGWLSVEKKDIWIILEDEPRAFLAIPAP